jgi:hypothetical protein
MRGFEVMQDVLLRDKSAATFNPVLTGYDFSVDVNRLKKTVELLLQKLFELLKKQGETNMTKEELTDHCFQHILTKVLIKMS